MIERERESGGRQRHLHLSRYSEFWISNRRQFLINSTWFFRTYDVSVIILSSSLEHADEFVCHSSHTNFHIQSSFISHFSCKIHKSISRSHRHHVSFMRVTHIELDWRAGTRAIPQSIRSAVVKRFGTISQIGDAIVAMELQLARLRNGRNEFYRCKWDDCQQ